MRKSSLFFLTFICFSLYNFAQVSVTGRILNDETGEPIPNVSVYINNTTIGVNSDAEGNYLLKSIKPGIYEIITSHISFDMLVHRIEVTDKNMRISFRLVPKVQQMRNIVVMSPDMRKKWIAKFKEYFLGQSHAASKSKIINEEDIFFEKGKTSKTIVAFSETPLIVENRELGYRIYFDLAQFFYDETDGRTFFYGFSRYEELDPRKSVASKWQRNRERNYYGSTQHFYHSLLENNLEAQNFTMFLRRPMAVSADTMLQGSSSSGAVTIKNLNGISVEKRQAPEIAVPVAAKDILTSIDTLGGKLQMKWKGKLVVRYKKNPYGKDFLRRKGYSAGYLPQGAQSEIEMIEESVYVDPNGCLENPLAVTYTGYWSYERLANMLPIDYRPGSK